MVDEIPEQHLEAMRKGAECLRCPLLSSGRGPANSEIRPGTKAILIGQEIGTDEVKAGKPFVGQSGKELNRSLRQAGVTRNDVSIANVISCQTPPKLGIDRYLKQCKERGLPSPIDCCAPRLHREIEDSQATSLITLGAYAMEAVAKLYKIPIGGRKQKPGDLALASISQQRGHPLALPDGKVLMPTLHPAYALRSARHLLQPIRDDIAKGVAIGRRGHIHNPEPAYLLRPTITTVLEWCATAVREDRQIIIDIETSGLSAESAIRCIGMGYDLGDDASVICVPFELRNGSTYWDSQEEHEAALTAVKSVLNNCRLVAHNGAFDSKVLLHHGWLEDRNKLWDDTLLAHHNSREVECPHKLSFVSTRFAEVPMWKNDTDHKAIEASDEDDDYWRYNVKDVFTTLVSWRGLQKWLTEDETWPQYEMEKILSRIYRDVGELGWHLDETQRQDLSKQIHVRVDALRAKLRGCVGDAWQPGKRCKKKRSEDSTHTCEKCMFNPNSHVQVAWYLYKHLGLMPPMNSKGKKWSEDDEFTTSAPVLLALIDHGVDENTFKFIDTLVVYKSAEKLRSSYIDSMDPKKDRSKQTKKPVDLRPSVFSGLNHLHVSWNVAAVDTGRLSSNPNCFHPDTFVLTKRGWVPVAEVTVEDEVAQFWRDTLVIDYARPTFVTSRDFDGSLVSLGAENLETLACVTSDHRMLYKIDGELVERTASEALERNTEALLYLNEHIIRLQLSEKYRSTVQYSGKVHCLSVPSSYVVAKFGRYGTPLIIGQCQNIPARTSLNIKTMFVAPPGHVLVKGDFDQIELRIFAAESGDEVMIDAFLRGKDAHSLNAATVFSEIEGKSVQEIYDWLEGGGATPEQRDQYRLTIKGVIFGKSYGAGDKKLYDTMISSRDKATNERLLPHLQRLPRKEGEALVKKISAVWDKVHPWMKKYQNNLFETEKKQGFLAEPVSGRKRYLPDGANSPGVILNVNMQSAAAVFANRAAIVIDEKIPHKSWSPYTGICGQVHDEIIVCVPEERVAEAMKIMKEAMTFELKGVPITATPEACRRWSGPICKCGAAKKSHKKKLPKGCSGFEPRDPVLDSDVVV